MERRRLGRTDLDITPIGLGAWAIGGPWLFGWGPQDDRASIETIHAAADRGINWIDTAPAYGLGHSEEVVGRALRELPPADRPLVFTKCSLVWNEQREVTHSLRPDSIRREVDASLRRLGVERLDLYQVHWPNWPSSPDGHDPGPLEPAWETLDALEREGKVRHIGASNFTVPELERVEAISPVASLQPPYSLLRRDAEANVLPWCRAHNVGVIVYSPMQSGLLSGAMTRERFDSLATDDWRRRSPYFQEPAFTRNLTIVEQLKTIGEEHGRTAGEVAIAWTLANPAVTAAIVGARRADQLDGIVGAGTFRLSDDERHTIEELAIPVS